MRKIPLRSQTLQQAGPQFHRNLLQAKRLFQQAPLQEARWQEAQPRHRRVTLALHLQSKPTQPKRRSSGNCCVLPCRLKERRSESELRLPGLVGWNARQSGSSARRPGRLSRRARPCRPWRAQDSRGLMRPRLKRQRDQTLLPARHQRQQRFLLLLPLPRPRRSPLPRQAPQTRPWEPQWKRPELLGHTG